MKNKNAIDKRYTGLDFLDLLYPVGRILLRGNSLGAYVPGEWEKISNKIWTLERPDGTKQYITEYWWERVR